MPNDDTLPIVFFTLRHYVGTCMATFYL